LRSGKANQCHKARHEKAAGKLPHKAGAVAGAIVMPPGINFNSRAAINSPLERRLYTSLIVARENRRISWLATSSRLAPTRVG
jgi:hypothetical protein